VRDLLADAAARFDALGMPLYAQQALLAQAAGAR